MNRPALCRLLLLVIVAGALAIRFYHLDQRPMHNDEANQAVRAGVLLETGKYRYDPTEHHGPTLYYLTLPFEWLTAGRKFADTTEVTYRAVPVVFGVATILLLLLLTDGLGWLPVLIAGLLAAISPALVYYNRFYIQESLLVFFTFGAIAAGWRYAQTRLGGWALLCGMFLGFMYATKETAVIAYVAAAVGIAVVTGTRLRERVPLLAPHLVGAGVVALGVVFVFYSSFFTHWRGPLDSLLAYGSYLHKAGGTNTDHVHPWYFYLQILGFSRYGRVFLWSEGLIIVLALIGAVAAWRDERGGLMRFLVVYTGLMTLAYSIIPYKTPWNLLPFWFGWVLLAGIGSAALYARFEKLWIRLALLTLFAAGAVQLSAQMRRASFRWAADPRNPYVYSQTSVDCLNLTRRVEELAALDPAGREMLIAVVTPPDATWPLPWYFRKFSAVGYWPEPADLPEALRPSIIITPSDADESVTASLGQTHHTEIYGLRPGVLLALHVKRDLWDRFIKTRATTGAAL